MVITLSFPFISHATLAATRSEAVGFVWQYQDNDGWQGRWERVGTVEPIAEFVPFEGVFTRGEERLSVNLLIRITRAGEVTVWRSNGKQATGVSDCTYQGVADPPIQTLGGEGRSYLAKTIVRGQFTCLNDKGKVFEWSAEFN